MIIISGVLSLSLMCRLGFIKVLMSCICCLYMITNFSLNPIGVTEFQFKNQENNSTLGYVTKKGNYLWVRFLPIAFFFFFMGTHNYQCCWAESNFVSASFQWPPVSFSCSRIGIVCLWELTGRTCRCGCPPIPLPVSDMEVMCVQEHHCDPAQPVETNCYNWVVSWEWALGVMLKTKGTGNRRMASCASSQP